MKISPVRICTRTSERHITFGSLKLAQDLSAPALEDRCRQSWSGRDQQHFPVLPADTDMARQLARDATELSVRLTDTAIAVSRDESCINVAVQRDAKRTRLSIYYLDTDSYPHGPCVASTVRLIGASRSRALIANHDLTACPMPSMLCSLAAVLTLQEAHSACCALLWSTYMFCLPLAALILQEDAAIEPQLQIVNAEHEYNSRLEDVLATVCEALGVECSVLKPGDTVAAAEPDGADAAEDMDDDGDDAEQEDDDESEEEYMADDDDVNLTVSATFFEDTVLDHVHLQESTECAIRPSMAMKGVQSSSAILSGLASMRPTLNQLPHDHGRVPACRRPSCRS